MQRHDSIEQLEKRLRENSHLPYLPMGVRQDLFMAADALRRQLEETKEAVNIVLTFADLEPGEHFVIVEKGGYIDYPLIKLNTEDYGPSFKLKLKSGSLPWESDPNSVCYQGLPRTIRGHIQVERVEHAS